MLGYTVVVHDLVARPVVPVFVNLQEELTGLHVRFPVWILIGIS